MANVGTLTLDLIAKLGGFTGPIDQAERKVRWFSKQAQQANADAAKSFESLSKSMEVVAVAAGTFLVEKIAELGKAFIDMSVETAKAASELQDMADASGVTIQAMDEFINSASLAHIEASQITQAIQHLSQAIEKAKDPTSAQAKIFQVLAEATGKNILKMTDMAEILKTVSEGFSKFEGGTARSAAAAELLGRSGQKLLSFFSKSQEDMADLTAEAEKFGGVLSDLEAEKLKKVDSAFHHLGLSMQSFMRASAETSSSFVDNVSLMIKGAGDFIAFEDRFVAHMKGGGVEFGHGPFDDRVAHFERTEDFMAKMDSWLPRTIDGSTKLAEAAKTPFPTIDPEAMKRTEEFLKKAKELAVKQEKDSADAIRKIDKDLASDIEKLQIEAIVDPVERANAAYDLQIKKVKDLALLQSTSGVTVDPDEIKQKLALLEQVRITKLATEAQKNLDEFYKKGTEVTKANLTVTEEYSKEIERLTDFLYAGAISQETFNKAKKAAGEKGFEKSPIFNADTLDPMQPLMDAEKAQNDWYAKQLQLLSDYRATKMGTNEEWNAKEQELAQEHADELQKINTAKMHLELTSASDLFGSLASIAGTFAGEQSKIYKEMFVTSKAFSIASATLDMFQAIAKAGTLPFPANIGAMATVAAAMASIVSNISAVGLAHEGMDFIPKSGSWILEKGERVTTEKTSKRLDRTLDRIQKDERAGQGTAMNVNIHEAPGTAAQVMKRPNGGLDVHIALIEERLLERINRGTGLAGPFDSRYGRKY